MVNCCFMKCMITSLIANTFIIHVVSSSSSSAQNEIPLNFIDSLIFLNEKHKYINNFNSTIRYDGYSQLVNDNFSFMFDEFYRNIDHSFVENIENIFATNISKPCLNDIKTFAKALSSKQTWAFSVIDSFGKIPSGILRGSLLWLGEYSECNNITVKTNNSTWNGKYCMITKPFERTSVDVQLNLFYGICSPSSCSVHDIVQITNFVLKSSYKENLLSKINSSYVECYDEKKFDAAAISAIVILSIIGFIILVATMYDLFKVYLQNRPPKTSPTIVITQNDIENYDNNDDHAALIEANRESNSLIVPESIFSKVIRSFSAYNNSLKVFSTKTNDDQLKCLHGFRFLSISWVILGHVYVFSLSFTDNVAIFLDWEKRISFFIIISGVFSVDTFFLLSGLLTSYIFMRELNKPNVKFSLKFMFKYYIHRYWRLTPALAIVIMFNASLSRYLGSGPLYPKDGFEKNMCKTTWWTNLLYINNFYALRDECFPVSWYLANDMQFHFIAPLMIIPLAFKKHILAGIVGFMFLISCFLSVSIILYNNPGAESMFYGDIEKFMRYIYCAPWSRIGPFVIGIFLGYIIYLHKNNQITIRLPKFLNIICWLVSITLCLLLIFGLYPDTNGHPLSRTTHIFYQTFSRTTWAIAVGYMIFSCVLSRGGFINTLLSWQIWVPLSRITYSIYLVHVVVLMYFFATMEHPFHSQDSIMINFFLSNWIISCAFGFIFSIICEIPLIGLEKLIFIEKS